MTVASLKPDMHQDCTKQKPPELKMPHTAHFSLWKVPYESHTSVLSEQPDVVKKNLFTRQLRACSWGKAQLPSQIGRGLPSAHHSATAGAWQTPDSKVTIQRFRLPFALAEAAGKGSVAGSCAAFIRSFV